jgi:hypothetical protein
LRQKIFLSIFLVASTVWFMARLLDGEAYVTILMRWNERRGLLAAPVTVGLRNVHNPTDMAAAGITHSSVGHPA